MPQVTVIEPSGQEVQLDVPVGWSLMQAATSSGIEGIVGECGGSCACATCHCYIESHLEQIPPPQPTECDMLANAAAAILPNSRLSCQIRMTEQLAGMIIRLPETQL
jgi:2Fe-2S ferredoxin